MSVIPQLTKGWAWANGVAGASIVSIAFYCFFIGIETRNAIAFLTGCIFLTIFYFFTRFVAWWKSQQAAERLQERRRLDASATMEEEMEEEEE